MTTHGETQDRIDIDQSDTEKKKKIIFSFFPFSIFGTFLPNNLLQIFLLDFS